jgi:hypothetical protein
MIPPFLITKAASILGPVAAKFSSPLVKWGLIAAVFVGSNLWTWHKTTLQCEQDKTEAIAIQAKAFSEKEAQIVAGREDVYRQLNATKQATSQQIVDLQKRMVLYERNAKKTNVPVPPDSVGMFNAISSLLPSQNLVSVAEPAPTGEPNESPEARIEVTRLLLAYVQAYGHCGGELKELWDTYAGLVQAIRSQYTIQQEE